MKKDQIIKQLKFNDTTHYVVDIQELEHQNYAKIVSLPFSARVLIENLVRNIGNPGISEENVVSACKFYENRSEGQILIPFYPGRVLMQDFTGVPAVVDLAAMRDAVVKVGHDPKKINPMIPVDLIIDHSIQVDHFREKNSSLLNAQKEYKRNKERYKLLKWAQENFDNFRVVPPESGICHQVNLEYLASVVTIRNINGNSYAFPDTLVGTDSHTTMINGLGVLGWGVGGIEAEAVMLGQPYYMNLPEIIGVRLIGRPSSMVTATDIALFLTERLRQENVVEKIVEYTGPGLKYLNVTDRATIANMAPEYGATAGFFPVDTNTLDFLKKTGRQDTAYRVETYCRACGLFNNHETNIIFSKVIEIDLSAIKLSIAGPSKPKDRILLTEIKEKTRSLYHLDTRNSIKITCPNKSLFSNFSDRVKYSELSNGSIVIAAITSCTNTSNPYNMIGAGLVAKKAIEKGLSIPWYVKTSLSPGSRVVMEYLKASGLMENLEKLGFNNTGFGCMTCIGNSGHLDPFIEKAINTHQLDVVSVLSGNRNFEARIHQKVRGNFLMSPILVLIYAIAGRIDIDLDSEAIGIDKNNNPVFMKDIWPKADEINRLVEKHVKEEFFRNEYSQIFQGNSFWQEMESVNSIIFDFDSNSTYIRNPPFFKDFSLELSEFSDILGARVLLMLGDSITTDHISPAGAIPKDYPAGKYLINSGVEVSEFNSYGSRRGNHEVMMRGTFANIRIKNRLVDETGGVTLKFPEQQIQFVFDASMNYQANQIPLLVLAGKEYGTGSSRDWAAKGTSLLGVKAVIAQSFERIHRSNLVGMGVLPLVFINNQSIDTLNLKGDEIFSIQEVAKLKPNDILTVHAEKDGIKKTFQVRLKLNTQIEIDYIKNNGILQYVLRNMITN